MRIVVPQVGVHEVTLYDPADKVYEWLKAKHESQRLAQVSHLGALRYTFPGDRHVRWDYTLAMLY